MRVQYNDFKDAPEKCMEFIKKEPVQIVRNGRIVGIISKPMAENALKKAMKKVKNADDDVDAFGFLDWAS